MVSAPGPHVLAAFGLTGEPVRLEGGQGRAYRVGDTVLRPVEDPTADEWAASTMAAVVEDGFRVPRPRKPSGPAGWAAGGWIAWSLVAGEHRTRGADWSTALATSFRFHEALRPFPRPSFLGRRTDLFAVADRFAWGETHVGATGPLGAAMSRLTGLCRPVPQQAQLVHGDVVGNLLWSDGLPPAVIDLSPSWRPAGLGAAQVVVDAVLWYGAPTSLADELLAYEPVDGRQLVLRALVFRLAVHALMLAGATGVLWTEDQVARDLHRAAPLEDWVARG